MEHSILQSFWECYFWMFSEHPEMSSKKKKKTLDERPTKTFQKKNIL